MFAYLILFVGTIKIYLSNIYTKFSKKFNVKRLINQKVLCKFCNKYKIIKYKLSSEKIKEKSWIEMIINKWNNRRVSHNTISQHEETLFS